LTGEQKIGKGGVGLYKNVYMHVRKSTRTVQKRSRRKIERKKNCRIEKRSWLDFPETKNKEVSQIHINVSKKFSLR
jgi:hypothetical protein